MSRRKRSHSSGTSSGFSSALDLYDLLMKLIARPTSHVANCKANPPIVLSSPSPPLARQTALPTAGVTVPLRAAGLPVQCPPQPAAGGVAASAGSAGLSPIAAPGGRPWQSPAGTVRLRATLLRP